MIEVTIVIKTPDGVPQLAVIRGDMTVNPEPTRFDIEAQLAKAAVNTLGAEAVAATVDKLTDWQSAVERISPQREG